MGSFLSNTAVSLVDIAIIVVFFVFIFRIGIYLRKFVKEPEDFVVAGRHMPPFILAATLAAANISLYNFLSYTGYSYRDGISIVWHEWSGLMAMAFAGIFVFPILRRIKLSTVPEFLGRRYNKGLRTMYGSLWVMRIAVTLGLTLYLSSQILCTILGIPDVGISYVSILLIFAVITIIYTAAGGMWSVILTNVIQFALVLGGALIMIPLIMHSVGYLSGINEKIIELGRENLLNLMPSDGFWNWKGVLGIWLLGMQWACTDQHILQQALSSNTVKNGVKALVLAGIIMIPFALIIPMPGLAAIVKVSSGEIPALVEQDNILPMYIKSGLIPIGLLGLIICGLIASQLSTISSHLSTSTTVISLDIINAVRRKKMNDRQKLLSLRIGLLLMGIVMIFTSFIAKNAQSAIDVYITMIAIVDLPLFVLMLYGIFWKRATSMSAVVSYIVALIIGLILQFHSSLGSFFTSTAENIYSIYSIIPILGEGVSTHNANSWDIAIIGMIVTGVMVPFVSLFTRQKISDEVNEIFENRYKNNPIQDKSNVFNVWPKHTLGKVYICVMLCGLIIFLAGVIAGKYPAKTGYGISYIELQRFEQAAFLMHSEDLSQKITVEKRQALLNDLTLHLKITTQSETERKVLTDDLIIRMKDMMQEFIKISKANPKKYHQEYLDEFKERFENLKADSDSVFLENQYAGYIALFGMLLYFFGALMRLRYD